MAEGQNFLEKLAATKPGWVLILIVTSLTNLALYLIITSFPNALIASSWGFVVAAASYGVPRAAGIRSLRSTVKMGLLSFVIVSVIIAVISTSILYSVDNKARPDDTGFLGNGMVDPVLGDASTDFNFTVSYLGNDSSNSSVHLSLAWTNLTFEGEEYLNVSMIRMSGTQSYYYETTLDENMYWYAFYVTNRTGVVLNETERGDGPLNVPIQVLFPQSVFVYLSMLMVTAGFSFFLLVGLMWITRKSKTGKQDWKDKQKESPEELEKPLKDLSDWDDEDEYEDDESYLEEEEDEDDEGSDELEEDED